MIPPPSVQAGQRQQYKQNPEKPKAIPTICAVKRMRCLQYGLHVCEGHIT